MKVPVVRDSLNFHVPDWTVKVFAIENNEYSRDKLHLKWF